MKRRQPFPELGSSLPEGANTGVQKGKAGTLRMWKEGQGDWRKVAVRKCGSDKVGGTNKNQISQNLTTRSELRNLDFHLNRLGNFQNVLLREQLSKTQVARDLAYLIFFIAFVLYRNIYMRIASPPSRMKDHKHRDLTSFAAVSSSRVLSVNI